MPRRSALAARAAPAPVRMYEYTPGNAQLSAAHANKHNTHLHTDMNVLALKVRTVGDPNVIIFIRTCVRVCVCVCVFRIE